MYRGRGNVTEETARTSDPRRGDDGQPVLLDSVELAHRSEVGHCTGPEPIEGLCVDHVLQSFVTDVGSGGFPTEDQAVVIGG